MIRPLIYCTETEHFDKSIETINQRIEELIKLKEEYSKKSLNYKKMNTLLKDNTLGQTSKKAEKVLIIDNYDSFTYNLVHLLQELGQEYEVVRNDKFALDYVEQFDKILLSPGPGLPQEAGLLLEVIERYAETKSILGICLGQQAIAEFFGAKLFNLSKPLHGVATNIIIKEKNEKLFHNYPIDSKIGRYHSWAVDHDSLPDCIQVTAVDDNNVIMGISHKTLDIKGLQFHPESILTDNGKILIANWLK